MLDLLLPSYTFLPEIRFTIELDRPHLAFVTGDIQHSLLLLSHYKPGDFVASAIIPQEKHSRIEETMEVIVHFRRLIRAQAQNLLQAGSPLTGDGSMCCRGGRSALPDPSTHRDCLPRRCDHDPGR